MANVDQLLLHTTTRSSRITSHEMEWENQRQVLYGAHSMVLLTNIFGEANGDSTEHRRMRKTIFISDIFHDGIRVKLHSSDLFIEKSRQWFRVQCRSSSQSKYLSEDLYKAACQPLSETSAQNHSHMIHCMQLRMFQFSAQWIHSNLMNVFLFSFYLSLSFSRLLEFQRNDKTIVRGLILNFENMQNCTHQNQWKNCTIPMFGKIQPTLLWKWVSLVCLNWTQAHPVARTNTHKPYAHWTIYQWNFQSKLFDSNSAP